MYKWNVIINPRSNHVNIPSYYLQQEVHTNIKLRIYNFNFELEMSNEFIIYFKKKQQVFKSPLSAEKATMAKQGQQEPQFPMWFQILVYNSTPPLLFWGLQPLSEVGSICRPQAHLPATKVTLEPLLPCSSHWPKLGHSEQGSTSMDENTSEVSLHNFWFSFYLRLYCK